LRRAARAAVSEEADMTEKIEILFGKSHLAVALPPEADVQVIRKRKLPKLPDPRGAVRAALDAPMGAKPLRQLATGRRSACILICDITRPVPNRLFLRPMIEDLMAAGMARERIHVLVATGLHRPNEGAELAAVVGDPWVLENVAVTNHDARNDAAHVDFGKTRTRGTPVAIDRHFVEADLRIATGL